MSKMKKKGNLEAQDPSVRHLLGTTYRAPRDFFPYETIKFSARLEFIDRRGVAVFSRRQRIRFLEDGVTTFFDLAWGEGILFANYTAGPLRILDAIRTPKGYVVALALPRPYHKGEVFEIDVRRRIVGSFLDEQVYWDTAMRVPTELFTIDVVPPYDRRIRHPEIAAPPQGDFDASESPKPLRLRVKQPAVHIPYKLSWSWK